MAFYTYATFNSQSIWKHVNFLLKYDALKKKLDAAQLSFVTAHLVSQKEALLSSHTNKRKINKHFLTMFIVYPIVLHFCYICILEAGRLLSSENARTRADKSSSSCFAHSAARCQFYFTTPSPSYESYTSCSVTLYRAETPYF